jgi:crossover junction endodeoxyribonuclease RuvC
VADADPQAAAHGSLRPVRLHAQGALPMLVNAIHDGGTRDDHDVGAVLSSDGSRVVRYLSNGSHGTTILEPCQASGTKILEWHVGGPAGAYHAGVITLGIDPGTAICGFGVVGLDEGRLRMVDAGCIRTPSDASDAERLRQLHDALRGLIAQHRPGRIGVERLFFQRNVQTAMAVGQARGVALLVAAVAGVPIDEPTPNEVKQAVCGSGSADKAQVATMVERLLGVSLAGVPDDATDALAIAIGCAHRAAAQPKAVIG